MSKEKQFMVIFIRTDGSESEHIVAAKDEYEANKKALKSEGKSTFPNEIAITRTVEVK